jgi:cytochrome b
MLKVWDSPTRIFHWLLVGLIIFSVVTAKLGGNWTPWHMRSGYAILALILFRVLWGFIGSDTARFAQFVRSPQTVVRYLLDTARGTASRFAGHNPAGGYSVLLLLATVLTQAVTGLFIDDEIANQGPLYNKVSGSVVAWATRIHHWNEKVMYVAVGLHIAAICYYVFIKRESLVKPMLGGSKPWPDPAAAPQIKFAPLWRAAALAAAVSGFVYWLVVVFPKA